MLSVQTMGNQITTGVKVVQDGIRVALGRSSKHNDLIVFRSFDKALPSKGADVDACYELFPGLESNRDLHIGHFCRFVAVYQGLIEIEYDSLAISMLAPSWQYHRFLSDELRVHIR